MNFKEVVISSLRCIHRLDVQLVPGVNLVVGRNGAGKTTFLEAIGFVGLGRSFSSASSRDIIREGSSAAHIRASVEYKNTISLDVQVTKSSKGTRITVNGRLARSTSELASQIPILLLNSRVADIFTGGPHARRTLIDRVMFHVKHNYLALWRDYKQALMQRNSIIRGSKDRQLARFWTERLVRGAEEIDSHRRGVVSMLNHTLEQSVLRHELGDIELIYQSGWTATQPLLHQLEERWQKDVELGYTRLGAHRSDVQLCLSKKPASRRLSRGQLKVIGSESMLGLAKLIKEKTGLAPVILVDDLQAELDDVLRDKVVDKIIALGGQKIFTSITPSSIPELIGKADKMFHVEQQNTRS